MHSMVKIRKNTQIIKLLLLQPSRTYGSEISTTTVKQENGIQAQEMKFLQKIKGCTREDKFGN